MSENQVTLIPAEVITQAVDLATQLTTLLAPYMQALTAAERHGILKMGDKTIAFVNKTLDYAQTTAVCPHLHEHKGAGKRCGSSKRVNPH